MKNKEFDLYLPESCINCTKINCMALGRHNGKGAQPKGSAIYFLFNIDNIPSSYGLNVNNNEFIQNNII